MFRGPDRSVLTTLNAAYFGVDAGKARNECGCAAIDARNPNNRRRTAGWLAA
jgi:hypothetical protein